MRICKNIYHICFIEREVALIKFCSYHIYIMTTNTLLSLERVEALIALREKHKSNIQLVVNEWVSRSSTFHYSYRSFNALIRVSNSFSFGQFFFFHFLFFIKTGTGWQISVTMTCRGWKTSRSRVQTLWFHSSCSSEELWRRISLNTASKGIYNTDLFLTKESQWKVQKL